jgi:hypothetical protein
MRWKEFIQGCLNIFCFYGILYCIARICLYELYEEDEVGGYNPFRCSKCGEKKVGSKCPVCEVKKEKKT